MESKINGSWLRQTRGTYTYKTGDWTYEELKEHRRELLDEKALVWGALGFDQTHMTTAQIVADRATTLRGPFGWVKVLWRRAMIARIVAALLLACALTALPACKGPCGNVVTRGVDLRRC